MKKLLLFGAFIFSSAIASDNIDNNSEMPDLTQEEQDHFLQLDIKEKMVFELMIVAEIKKESKNLNKEETNKLLAKIKNDPEGVTLTPKELKLAMLIEYLSISQIYNTRQESLLELLAQDIAEGKTEEDLKKIATEIQKKLNIKQQLTPDEFSFLNMKKVTQIRQEKINLIEKAKQRSKNITPPQKSASSGTNSWINASMNQGFGANKK